jgi:membrane-associated phospholipid phosphatase
MKISKDTQYIDQHLPEAGNEIFSSNNPQVQLAQVISKITNPLFIAVPLFLIISLNTALTTIQGLLWWIITVLGITIAPYVFVLRGVSSGKYSDHNVSDRKQRLVPLSFGLGCIAITFAILILIHASIILIATITSAIVVLVITIVITQKWKISLHAAGITGAVTTIIFVFGPIYLFLTILIAVVGWARWKVRAHTPLQIIAGLTLSAIVTIATWLAFGLH